VPADIREQIQQIKKVLQNIDDQLAVPLVWEKTRDPFWVLIATVISIRTREEQTIKASLELYNNAKTPWGLLRISDNELFDILRNCGLASNKVKWLKEIAKRWISKCKELGVINEQEYLTNFNRYKFCDEQFLLSLPGVGRKVMNVYLNLVCNKPVIAVDTHVHRIANRLGWVKTKTPEQTEKALYKIIPRQYWREINALLVKFGRNICRPINPKCDICPLKEHCEYYKSQRRTKP